MSVTNMMGLGSFGTPLEFSPAQPYTGLQFPAPHSPFHYNPAPIPPWQSSRLPTQGVTDILPPPPVSSPPITPQFGGGGGNETGQSQTPHDNFAQTNYNDITSMDLASGLVNAAVSLSPIGTYNSIASLSNSIFDTSLPTVGNIFGGSSASAPDASTGGLGPGVGSVSTPFGDVTVDSRNLDTVGFNFDDRPDTEPHGLSNEVDLDEAAAAHDIDEGGDGDTGGK